MYKIYRLIIKSSKEPNKENIWLYDDSLYYYENGKWKLIKDKVYLNNSQDKEANVQAPIIKLNNTTTDKIYNIETCSKLSTSEVVSVNIEGTIGGLTYDTIGIYHNGMGIVKKQIESPDIYSCYLNSGGTKTITQFCDELFSLIGG